MYNLYNIESINAYEGVNSPIEGSLKPASKTNWVQSRKPCLTMELGYYKRRRKLGWREDIQAAVTLSDLRSITWPMQLLFRSEVRR